MSRWKAAGLHLCVSILIAGMATWLLLGVWYPPPYFHASGGGKLLALIIGVDVSIGPLLTLLVFKAGKRGLKFDLTVIALLQAAALIYGIHTVVRSRPVFMAAVVDRFVLVDADQIDPKDLAQASRPEWSHLSWNGPVLVGTRRPESAKASNALLMLSFTTGKDLQNLPKYYVPYAKAASGLLKHAHPVAQLRKIDPSKTRQINQWLATRHLSDSQVVWVPIQTRGQDMAMMMNARNGQPIGPLEVNPWPADKGTAKPIP